MVSTGIVQLMHQQQEVDKMKVLGYPLYFLTIIGIWKMLGVVALLIPRNPLLKEWAYAGFFFLITGAVFSHAAVHDQAAEYFGPVLLLVLIAVSWYMRPADRRIAQAS
jgi:hypothetical protein